MHPLTGIFVLLVMFIELLYCRIRLGFNFDKVVWILLKIRFIFIWFMIKKRCMFAVRNFRQLRSVFFSFKGV